MHQRGRLSRSRRDDCCYAGRSLTATIQFPCANCGAQLHVDGSSQMTVCGYCHQQTMLPADVWRRFEEERREKMRSDVLGAATQVATTVDKGVRYLPLIVGVAVVVPIVAAIVIIVAVSGSTSAIAPSISTPTVASLTAKPGDACGGRTVACSADGKSELHCGDGDKLVATLACKGPNGCRVSTDKTTIVCDYTLAEVKDPCDVDDGACSTDHKAELRCVANHFAVANTCKGPDGCTLSPNGKGQGYTLSCDDHVADVGDPCAGADRTACSSDKKSFLVCTQQKFVVEKSCKRGCTVKKLAGTGNVEMDCN